MSTRTIASRLLRSGPSHRPFSSCPRRQNSAQAVAETHGSSTSSLSAVTPEATSSSSTASSSNFAIKAESGRSTSKSSAKIISSLILSRLPTILREPSAFETAYFNYNQRLAEALQQPFARDFYFKKGSAIEAKFNEEQAKLSLGFTDIEKPVKKTTQKTPESSNQSTAAEGVTEVQPLPRTTEADEQEDEKSLNRKLDRTLYLMVKSSDTAPWSFPATVLDKGDTLHRAAPKSVTDSLGTDMDIWMVSHLPIGLYKRAEQEKVYFLSAHILAGSPQLSKEKGDVADFQWLTREEIQDLLLKSEQSVYWQHVDDLLDP